MSFFIKGFEAIGHGIEKGAIGVANGVDKTAVGIAKTVSAVGEGVAAAGVCLTAAATGSGKDNCKTLGKLALKNVEEGPLAMVSGPFDAVQGVIDGTIGAAVAGTLVTVGELAKDVGLPGIGAALESKEVEAVLNIAASLVVAGAAAVATGGASVALEGAAAAGDEAALAAAKEAQEAMDAASFLNSTEGVDAAGTTTESVASAGSNAADIAAEEGGELESESHDALRKTEDEFETVNKDAEKPEPKTSEGKALKSIKQTVKFMTEKSPFFLTLNAFQWLAFLTCQSIPLGAIIPREVLQKISSIPLVPLASGIFDAIQSAPSSQSVFDNSQLNSLANAYTKACAALIKKAKVNASNSCDLQLQIDKLMKSEQSDLQQAIAVVKDAKKNMDAQKIQSGGLSDWPLLKGTSINPQYNLEAIQNYGPLAHLPQEFHVPTEGDSVVTQGEGKFAVCMKFTTKTQPVDVASPRWFQLGNTWSTLITLHDAFLNQNMIHDSTWKPGSNYKPSYCVMTTLSDTKLPGAWNELHNSYLTNTQWTFFTDQNTKKVLGTIEPCLTQGGDYNDPTYTGPSMTVSSNCKNSTGTLDGIGFLPFSSLWQTFFIGKAASVQLINKSGNIRPVVASINLGKDAVCTLVGGDTSMGQPKKYPTGWAADSMVPMVFTIKGVSYASRDMSIFSLQDGAGNFALSPNVLMYLFVFKDPAGCLNTIANSKSSRGWELYSHLKPRLIAMKKRHSIYKHSIMIAISCILLLVLSRFENAHPSLRYILTSLLVWNLWSAHKAGIFEDMWHIVSPPN